MKNDIPSVVVTFYTSAAAMAMEQACRRAGIPGKLCSTPRSLSSDCGIAWRSPLESKNALEGLIRQEQLEVEGVHEV